MPGVEPEAGVELWVRAVGQLEQDAAVAAHRLDAGVPDLRPAAQQLGERPAPVVQAQLARGVHHALTAGEFRDVRRVRALVRRSTGNPQPAISIGPVHLDPRTRQVTVNGVPVGLTPLEFRLLNYLLHHRGRVISQSELSDNLYSLNSERDSNAIEALVGRLRRKLKADIIETRRGFGYCVRQDAA